MDSSPPGSSVRGILQARKLGWVAISFSRGSSWSRDRTSVSCVSYTAGKFFTGWAIRTSVKCYYPIGLLTAQKRLPLVQSPPSILWGYTLCHSETGKDVFKADDNKNNLLVLVKSTNGFFFSFFLSFYSFFVDGHETCVGFSRLLSGKESVCQTVNAGSIPGSGRSPGEGNGSPLHYSCLGIPWTEESGRLQSMGSQRVRHDSVPKQQEWNLCISKIPWNVAI